ncbi:transmembrane protein 272-like [Sardina pilchardus]|uniref:transmembrane protein 272-like n=1 Tax=Sardina pilchardus TaxID=27697 RepID=UPI002E118015
MECVWDRCTPSSPVLVTLKVLLFPISIAEIVIGALYLDSCPVQRYIPVYLVVAGVFTLSLVLLACLPGSHDPDVLPNQDAIDKVRFCGICNVWNFIVSFILLCWVIAGSVWIYSIHQPNYDPAAGDYCDKTVYLFAFWINLVNFIVAGVCIVVCFAYIAYNCAQLFCCCLCALCVKCFEEARTNRP